MILEADQHPLSGPPETSTEDLGKSCIFFVRLVSLESARPEIGIPSPPDLQGPTKT